MPRKREVIDERFAIEELAGFGAMGKVYRARDPRSDGLVALKVVHDTERLELGRFAREAQILAAISHPGVVRYLDSGITADGEPYLVMEWVAGETLAARLQRAQLTVDDAVVLGRRVASALAAVHRGGIVHRDVKPSNLLLPGGAIDRVTLIDFGMARLPVADPKLTVTGTMLGTPGYLAPEQVYNLPNLDGRADVFSLGCVLYRCVSGRAPFRGPDALRTLLNGTPEQLPRLREFRPSIPGELDELVARMLARSPDDRPASADQVAAQLLAIEEAGARSPRAARARSDAPDAEHRLVSLVVARMPGPDEGGDGPERARVLQELAARHRGTLERISGNLALVVLSGAEAATDLAARAVRCARSLRPILGDAPAVVVTGLAVLGPRLGDSELSARAVGLLATAGEPATVQLDELTAALLDSRFDPGDLERWPEEPRLAARRVGPAAACVGRDQELEQLEMIFDQCAQDRVASMVLLSGPEGVGKSRLGHEFVRRLAARRPDVPIWSAAADALGQGSVFGLLGLLLCRALGVSHDDPPEIRRGAIRAWLTRHPGGGGPGFGAILGELLAGPLDGGAPGGVHRERAAQHGPRLPSGQIGHAFLTVLGARCAAGPVVIVLDDLQWVDPATLKQLYAALRALAAQPLLVLALGRSSVHELFPQLWADRCVQEIRLRKLSRRASAWLARQALGDGLSDAALRDLVERSDRRAAYLQALIRAQASGDATITPPAVLAMVHARIERLDPEARRVLRAASVFGETFRRAGVEALLGSPDTAAWLAVLVDQEMIEIASHAEAPADIGYRFAHPMVRQAAYDTIPPADRAAAHNAAGRWLEQSGDAAPQQIAEHLARGAARPAHASTE